MPAWPYSLLHNRDGLVKSLSTMDKRTSDRIVASLDNGLHRSKNGENGENKEKHILLNFNGDVRLTVKQINKNGGSVFLEPYCFENIFIHPVVEQYAVHHGDAVNPITKHWVVFTVARLDIEPRKRGRVTQVDSVGMLQQQFATMFTSPQRTQQPPPGQGHQSFDSTPTAPPTGFGNPSFVSPQPAAKRARDTTTPQDFKSENFRFRTSEDVQSQDIARLQAEQEQARAEQYLQEQKQQIQQQAEQLKHLHHMMTSMQQQQPQQQQQQQPQQQQQQQPQQQQQQQPQQQQQQQQQQYGDDYSSIGFFGGDGDYQKPYLNP